MVSKPVKELTAKHLLLINRIRKCMIQDELNHKWKSTYTKQWVDKFLNTIELSGTYTEHQGKILMEIRDTHIDELKSYYKVA